MIAGGLAASLLCTRRAAAAPDEMQAALRALLDGATPSAGGIIIDVPALVENGSSVLVEIAVDSPMTAEDHVTDIHVLSPENPLPLVSRFRLGPRCGKASIKTSVRLATTQVLHAAARLSNGSWRIATAEVEVTTAACFDPT